MRSSRSELSIAASVIRSASHSVRDAPLASFPSSPAPPPLPPPWGLPPRENPPPPGKPPPPPPPPRPPRRPPPPPKPPNGRLLEMLPPSLGLGPNRRHPSVSVITAVRVSRVLRNSTRRVNA